MYSQCKISKFHFIYWCGKAVETLSYQYSVEIERFHKIFTPGNQAKLQTVGEITLFYGVNLLSVLVLTSYAKRFNGFSRDIKEIL